MVQIIHNFIEGFVVFLPPLTADFSSLLGGHK